MMNHCQMSANESRYTPLNLKTVRLTSQPHKGALGRPMLHERVLAKFVESLAGNLQMKMSVQERLDQLIKAGDVHKRLLSGTHGFCVFNSTLSRI